MAGRTPLPPSGSRRALRQSYHHRLNKDGSLSHGWGTSYYLAAFQPAVRLAAITVGKAIGWPDPAATVMSELDEASSLIAKHSHLFNPQFPSDEEDLASAVPLFTAAVSRMPYNHGLRGTLGHLLLRAGRPAETKSHFETCLQLPHCDQRTRAGATYNLACAHALLGDFEACRHALEEADRLNALDRDWMQKDSDLASVRETGWFRQLCQRPAASHTE